MLWLRTVPVLCLSSPCFITLRFMRWPNVTRSPIPPSQRLQQSKFYTDSKQKIIYYNIFLPVTKYYFCNSFFMRTPMQRKYAIAWRIGGAASRREKLSPTRFAYADAVELCRLYLAEKRKDGKLCQFLRELVWRLSRQ